jgi:multidrug resistance efflux pump
LFRVDNPRFGNVEAMGQLNWVQELVDRLRVDSAEAELRFARQAELFKHHEALFQQKLITRMVYLEEETKVELCRISMNNRKDQLRAAELRRAYIEQQVALQKEAVVTMPFDGVVWSVRGQNGNQVGVQESVIHVLDPKRVWVDAFLHEKHAGKLQVGSEVLVRTVDSQESWTGRVESVRAGAGRVDPEQSVAVPAADLARRRVAVRVRLEGANPFAASQFFGVGRSVKVTVPNHENSSSSEFASARP